jgi:hypothetical protein
MQKNENKKGEKPMMAVEFTDYKGQKGRVLFPVDARRRFIKCVERELGKYGIVSEKIQKYLVFFGKINLKDKDFRYLSRKPKKPTKDSRNKISVNGCTG